MMPSSRRPLTGLVSACVLAALAGCSEGAGPGGGEMTVVFRRSSFGPTLSETGKAGRTRTLNSALASAPGACPFEAAGLTIDEIYLQGEGGRTPLRSDPVTLDLCDLSSQALLLVQDVQVPAGSYQEIRFVVNGGYVQDPADGTVYATEGYELPEGLPPADDALQMPSWGSTGLKVSFDQGPVTVGGEQKVIALDFDVAQSFGKPDGSWNWVMSPVIHVADISTGILRVRVQLGNGVTLPVVEGTQVTLEDFGATATLGAAIVTQAFDATQGQSVFVLAPGADPYIVTLNAPQTLDVTSTPQSRAVTINEGVAAAPVTFTLSSVGVAGPPNPSQNLPPSANFASPASPSFNATVGVPVRFDPAGTFDPEGPWGGTWNFGDGQTFTGTFGNYPSHILNHTYTAAGNYTVTWTIRDEQGATDVATTTAVVTAP